MAVVQISKIQVRRGKANASSIPQLAGGEFGWAVDTQKLFIGNGSTVEGAPYVGNTEILTERSNLFDLLQSYTYKGYDPDVGIQTGTDQNLPTTRTLQGKLDDFVSIRDFGAVGDGTSLDTAAIQRAIDQLYLNPADKTREQSKRTLYIPAGLYLIDSTLFIPSNVRLVGDGIDKTVIEINSPTGDTILQTVASSSTPGNPVFLENMSQSTQPKNVYIEGISFRSQPIASGSQPQPAIVLDCLMDSEFNSCSFEGLYINGAGLNNSGAELTAITASNNCLVQIRGLGTTTTKHVHFNNCTFNKSAHAVYSDYDSEFVHFDMCQFTNLFRAFTLAKASIVGAGSPTNSGPKNYFVRFCNFDKIDAEAFKVFNTTTRSIGHQLAHNHFIDVGNNNQGQNFPVKPIIDFGTRECSSYSDVFERNQIVNASNYANIPYLPDVLGVQEVKYQGVTSSLLDSVFPTSPAQLLKLPVWGNTRVVIDYTIRKSSTQMIRSGQIEIHAHPSQGLFGATSVPSINETFTLNGLGEGTVPDGGIAFYVTVKYLTGAFGMTYPTLVLSYSNIEGPGKTAIMNYTVKLISGLKDYS